MVVASRKPPGVMVMPLKANLSFGGLGWLATAVFTAPFTAPGIC